MPARKRSRAFLDARRGHDGCAIRTPRKRVGRLPRGRLAAVRVRLSLEEVRLVVHALPASEANQAKTRGLRRVRALERTPRSAAIDANEVECVRCKETCERCLLSECNCSLFVGLTHAGEETCGDRETSKRDHAYNRIPQSRGLKIWTAKDTQAPWSRGPTLNTSYTMSRISVLRQSRASRR